MQREENATFRDGLTSAVAASTAASIAKLNLASILPSSNVASFLPFFSSMSRNESIST
jgi:hypothetical protein